VFNSVAHFGAPPYFYFLPVAQSALISPNSVAHVIEAAHQHGEAISISPALDAVKKLTRSVGKLLCPQAEKSMIRVQRPISGLLN